MKVGDKVYYVSNSKQLAKGKIEYFINYVDAFIGTIVVIKRRNQGRSSDRGGTVYIPKDRVFSIDSDVEMLKAIYCNESKKGK